MKKALLLAAVAGLVLGSTALAQDSILFFDIRDNVSANQSIVTPVYPYINGAQNTGHAGDGQTLWVTPHYSNNFEVGKTGFPNNDADANTNTGKLWLYMKVNTDDSGGAGVISSIGLDFNVTAPATPRNTIGTLAFAWDSLVFAGANAGKANGTGGPTGWTGAKAALVPVSGSPPAFDTTGGLVPSANYYRLGAISVTGGPRNCQYGAGHITNSTYTLKMAVNGLLITRAFSGAPSDAVELVSFGYAAGVPETAVSGSVVGNPTSGLPDATIVVANKGDNSADGRLLATDIPGFNTALAAGTGLTQLQAFLNDFNGDRRVLATDIPGFNAMLAAPCP